MANSLEYLKTKAAMKADEAKNTENRNIDKINYEYLLKLSSLAGKQDKEEKKAKENKSALRDESLREHRKALGDAQKQQLASYIKSILAGNLAGDAAKISSSAAEKGGEKIRDIKAQEDEKLSEISNLLAEKLADIDSERESAYTESEYKREQEQKKLADKLEKIYNELALSKKSLALSNMLKG